MSEDWKSKKEGCFRRISEEDQKKEEVEEKSEQG